ncbi:PPOX class F420-dependent oxidoreductase [Ktedonosporobacter rubrisoli]|uniref:PPOX class F420-dependent oxidoreductase n=1 Tax=Ktedonosporobacter rubrisoli TaxID=2509675 RepID=A0A4P6JNH7_KTERU|nr:PPOX class F420-dependent oxidoreductase [Ktedonosporobacter rubrisoli]QBD76660.1 PPOX class F420-dependent oxidoreductase [Ktedonosporobacter rubrisoli]
MSIIPEQDLDMLKTKALAHIATLGPGGEPQNTPIWFEWDGTYIKFSLTKSRQKFRNVQRDPRVALSIADPSNPYHYLEIRGKVEHIEDDTDKAFVDTLAEKYLGTKYPYEPPEIQRVIIYVKPEHITRKD